MGISNIWVFSQESNGTATSGTLELLTHARTLGGSVTAFVGGDASAIAGILGEYGATKVYATGDLGGALPGAAVASAMKAVIDGGDQRVGIDAVSHIDLGNAHATGEGCGDTAPVEIDAGLLQRNAGAVYGGPRVIELALGDIGVAGIDGGVAFN